MTFFNKADDGKTTSAGGSLTKRWGLSSHHSETDGSGSTVHEAVQGSFVDSYDGRSGNSHGLQKTKMVRLYMSFASAILSCLCAGTTTAFSLYGHLFLSRLHYTQLQVNSVSIAAELACYLPVPLLGYLCDRYHPGYLALASSFLFGAGYLLAAVCYQKGPLVAAGGGGGGGGGGEGWPSTVMVLAFTGIGVGTSCLYMAAVTTCAKNFGRGQHKGLALGLPIAAFGLSGMWLSQFASRFLSETNSDGSRGEIDVSRLFLFLCILLFTVGLIGALSFQVVDEEELIDEAVEELERSGLLDDSQFFRGIGGESNYGTIMEDGDLEGMGPTSNEEEVKRKKTWLLNTETSKFLSDHTMWWLAAGFFLLTGAGEAFINNLGTIIGSLDTPPPNSPSSPSSSSSASSTTTTTPATHISIVALTSTLARITTGTLSDLLSPTSPSRIHISRVTLLLLSALLLSLGQILLASGVIQAHPERFSVVSALIGTGYGASFSLVPIIISVIWGVENFGTNWGIVVVVPAFGATFWALVYSWVYQAAANAAAQQHQQHQHQWGHGGGGGLLKHHAPATPDDERLCFGKECYAATFWGMAASVWLACAFWLYAWRGPGGWLRRGVLV
ncbi:MAG: putative monocarboxylate transporter mch1 [Peltula sp. TS41687]|nr:MAG: putative monocarboxylate transporter mch1 [Peltula sp. TS41687]